MEDAKDEVKRKFADLQTKISKEENGDITLDLTEAKHGVSVSKALDCIERASWRSIEGEEMNSLIRQAESEIKAFSDEALKQKASVENVIKLRSTTQTQLSNISFHFNELSSAVKNSLELEGNPEVQTAVRLAGSALSYITSRVNTKLTSAWITNYEIESEQSAVEEVKGYVEDLDKLVQTESDILDKTIRDRKIAQSTLDLALSKLEGLARTISDTGTNKEIEIQRAIEDSESCYLQAKRRFGLDENIDLNTFTDELMKKLSDTEILIKKISHEQNEKNKLKDSIELRVRKLSSKLDTIIGMTDACGTLVSERLEETIQTTKTSINNVIRLSRKENNLYQVSNNGGDNMSQTSESYNKLDSLINHANEDLDELEKTSIDVKNEITKAEEEYSMCKNKLDELSLLLRTCKNKAESYGCDHIRNVNTVIHEAELSIKICRLNMLGITSWINDSITIKALLNDCEIKVEIAEEEIDKDIINIKNLKQEEESLNIKYRQLQERHEKVCQAIDLLKTSPPPKILQAIAHTDKICSESLNSGHHEKSQHSLISLNQLELLVKEEEELLNIDVHESEIKLLELEKIATSVPILLTKLAYLDAQVEAAGVQVASLVEIELNEAHRAVRSVEHCLDTGTLPPITLREVQLKVTQAEHCIDIQVRRVTNANKAQSEIKSQLNDLQLSYDELIEASAIFWAKSSSQTDIDPSGAGILFGHQTAGGGGNSGGGGGGDITSNMNASRVSLSMRIINQAMKRSEQLLSHARRRIEVPINVWIEFGPTVAQNALDNAKEGIRSAKQVLDSEQIKLDSSDLERKQAKSKLEECSQSLISLRAMIDSFEECSDLSQSYDVVDQAERAIEVGFRVLSQGTVSSASAAIEVSIQKTKEAENICNNILNREEKNLIEKNNIKEMMNKERMYLESCKDTIAFLEIGQNPMIMDALSTADRALIGVDLVIKCEFGLSMLRKEFQLCKNAIEELNAVIEREKIRIDIENKNILKKKQEERQLKQRLMEQERQKVVNETMERRTMQDQLENALHRLQLYWPAVIDVQNSMNAVEVSVDTARMKLASGGLASANAAVSSALSKVQNLEQVVMNIEYHSTQVINGTKPQRATTSQPEQESHPLQSQPQSPTQPSPSMQYSPMSSADRNTPSESSRNMASSPLNSVHDNDSNMQLLESNLKEV